MIWKRRQKTAPAVPNLNEIAVAHVTDKYSSYPSGGLTPVKLAEILKEADAGDVLRQMELFEEMEEKGPASVQSAPDAEELGHGPGF